MRAGTETELASVSVPRDHACSWVVPRTYGRICWTRCGQHRRYTLRDGMASIRRLVPRQLAIGMGKEGISMGCLLSGLAGLPFFCAILLIKSFKQAGWPDYFR